MTHGNDQHASTLYYVSKKKKIMKDFNNLVNVAKRIVQAKYSPATVERVVQKAKAELEAILPRLPYVGGDDSPFTALMIQSAETIAFYRASGELGLSLREWGKLIYEIAENAAQSVPGFKKYVARKFIYSKKMQNYWRKWMQESQKQEFPENWMGTYVELPDSKDGAYGFNFMECGWIKLARKEECEEIIPYGCLGDYAKMHALGIGFRRTKTLAMGADCCDFRFGKAIQTPKGWPPEELEENKGSRVKLKGV